MSAKGSKGPQQAERKWECYRHDTKSLSIYANVCLEYSLHACLSQDSLAADSTAPFAARKGWRTR